MYLTLILLPGLSSLVCGLFGRKLGIAGANLISITIIIVTSILTLVAFYEVVLCNNPVYFYLGTWVSTDNLQGDWAFCFDSLTCSILLAVVLVSTMVHLFSIDYMAGDPHTPRFISYLGIFTFFMVVLVTGDSYLLLFLSWEGIGVASYLLVGFWYTRIAANKAAIQAITVNRIGDIFFTVALFAIGAVFGSLEYTTVFNLGPITSITAITIVGLLFLLAAMGKSAQIGLHTWLPSAMEGSGALKNIRIISVIFLLPVLLFIHLPEILLNLPRKVLETITGNMLGDGHITKEDNRSRFKMSQGLKGYGYFMNLFKTIYACFCKSEPYPRPKIDPTSFSFSTVSGALWSVLHSLWYTWDPKLCKYVKVLPSCLAIMFGPVSLAHWIMDDGYYDRSHKTTYICTEGFTKAECLVLIGILDSYGILATTKSRGTDKDPGACRIRISRLSIDRLRELVLPHMHKDMWYKLGI